MRAYGANNRIINNYFENNGETGIVIADGVMTAAGNFTYLQIKNLLVANNTLVGDGVTSRGGGLPPQGVLFINNIIKKDSGAFVNEGPGWQVTYQGNIFFGKATTAVPAGGFRNVIRGSRPTAAASRTSARAAPPSTPGSKRGSDRRRRRPAAHGQADVGADEVSTAPVRAGRSPRRTSARTPGSEAGAPR